MLNKSGAKTMKQMSATLILRTEVSIFKIKSFSIAQKETVTILKLVPLINNIKMGLGQF